MPTLDDKAAAENASNRLIALQNPDGSLPWLVTDPTAYQNVQGITALGWLETFKVTGDPVYVRAAGETRDWLVAYRDAVVPPANLSAPSVYFFAEYALESQNTADVQLAQSVLNDRIDRAGGPAQLIDLVVAGRVAEGNGNLGLWDASLFIRAAEDAGLQGAAGVMAAELAGQTTVNPFSASANYYELGLAGLILGLSEADLVAYKTTDDHAAQALRLAGATDGSWPITYGGVRYDHDEQTTAYALMALAAVGDVTRAAGTASYLRTTALANGGFPSSATDPTEYGEVDAEVASALVAAALVVPAGAVSYAHLPGL
ncbi:MAG: hypothetical protein ACYDCK_06250 [Thermoplasmatota archaeon]